MAASVPVNLEEEKQEISTSIARIGKYLAEYRKGHPIIAGQQQLVYSKTVEFASLTWQQPGYGFGVIIGPYQLNETWGEYGQDTCLDCHFDEDGNLKEVYLGM